LGMIPSMAVIADNSADAKYTLVPFQDD